ncbi:MAG: hypothetical protein Q4C34_03445 [Bacteroidales bacterium]|nr:hypothetical protein [Bacteroidales bacterium]
MSGEIKRLTMMVRIDDTARADIALTPERTYYRFATDSSIEDGELAAVQGDFATVAAAIVEAAAARDGEPALPADVKIQIFVNNRLISTPASDLSLRRVVDLLQPLAAEFTFLRGFC